MKPEVVLKHEFVDFIPNGLKEGVIYISIGFTTVAHNCCCGCGREVVTPLSPTDWKLIFDGQSVSLDPSIGNWSFPCQSHYWIRRNKVRWAERWTQAQIDAGRSHDRLSKERYFGNGPEPVVQGSDASVPKAPEDKAKLSLWRRLKRRLFG